MRIVIDIPEEEYECIRITGTLGNKTCIANAIENGIRLPKKHGRLIDADALDNSFLHSFIINQIPYQYRTGYRLRTRETDENLINAKTIIEAANEDNTREEKKEIHMSRLEILKQEREQISQMRCLSFDLMDKCKEWYDHEIECIEIREEEECTK